MAMKLSTTLGHIDDILNPVNVSLVKDFYLYLKKIGTAKTIKIRILDRKCLPIYNDIAKTI